MGCITKFFHMRVVYSRRMSRLTQLLLPMLADSKQVLDLGCGDGKIDSMIIERRPDIIIKGIDVLVRPDTYIDVMKYDGETIPYKDASFDTVMAIDVLHHTDNPCKVLLEMSRVSNHYIVLKDHVCNGFLSYIKLRAMDYVGNAHYHVRLPYNYLSKNKWNDIFENCGLSPVKTKTKLNLYKGIFHILFDGNLHFIIVLEKKSSCECTEKRVSKTCKE